jgi:hypothetical protein
LDENTKGAAQFRQVSGRYHPPDRVEVFLGETSTFGIDFETEEDAGGVANASFSCI